MGKNTFEDHEQEPTEGRRAQRRTKKNQILSLYAHGVTDLEELGQLADAKTSYVASVLQESGLLSGYFDLYTHSEHPMNVYSKLFSGKLGFKDEETARASIDLLEASYQEFESEKDRAGQHHALVTALTMYDRARWCGKTRAGDHFRRWLIEKLTADAPKGPPGPALSGQPPH